MESACCVCLLRLCFVSFFSFLGSLALCCCCAHFLQLRLAGPPLHCGARASHCSGFPVVEHRLHLGMQAYLSCGHMGLVAPWHVKSSWTRDQTCVPHIGRQNPNHWTTRKVLECVIIFGQQTTSLRNLSLVILYCSQHGLLKWQVITENAYRASVRTHLNEVHLSEQYQADHLHGGNHLWQMPYSKLHYLLYFGCLFFTSGLLFLHAFYFFVLFLYVQMYVFRTNEQTILLCGLNTESILTELFGIY